MNQSKECLSGAQDVVTAVIWNTLWNGLVETARKCQPTVNVLLVVAIIVI
jgi:hypothetical protein